MAATDPPLFKIGVAKNPHHRLSELQVSCPFDLVIFYKRGRVKREQAFNYERSLHALFRDKHQRGEWFRLEQADLQRVMRSPEVQYEQARKAFEAIASRQARSKKISRSRCVNRALGRDVAGLNDSHLRDPSRAASDVRARAIAEGQKTPCPQAFVHVREIRAGSWQQLEFADLN